VVSPVANTTYYVRYNGTCNTTSCASVVVTVTPTVGTPVFTLGATSTRCQGAGTVTYTASATNTTGITYTLDATTAAFAGNSIVSGTGLVTYAAGWNGISTITASADGCNGPVTATHTVTTYPPPTANAGTAVTTCSNAGGVNITAGSSTVNSTLATWTSSAGTGTFTNPTSLTTCLYTPSAADISAGSVTLTLTATGNSPCGTATPTKTLTIKMDGTWNGSLSADWNAAANWDCNLIPTLTSNVLIASSKPNYPNNSTSAIDQAKDLTIQNGASMTVTGNTLEIAGTITNSGTFTATSGIIEMIGSTAQTIPANTFAGNTIMDLKINNATGVTLGGALNITGIVRPTLGTLSSGGNLTLLSTAAQTALISGTGAGQVSGSVHMQRYLSSGYGYKYFGSPFSDATVSQFNGYLSSTATIPTFFLYDENHKNPPLTGTDMTGWTAYTSGTLNPMTGYAANLGLSPSVKTITLTGTVNNGNYSTTLYNHNGLYTQGFNLVGNPYPSPIDWNKAGWTKTNINDAIYFFNASGGTDEYSGSYSYYIGGVSTGGASNLISSMQAFFVRVADVPLPFPVTGSLGFSNSIRTDDLVTNFKDATIDPRTILRFAASFEGATDNPDPFVIYFDPATTPKFDSNGDALKLLNTDERLTNLYALTTDSRQVAISGMPYPTDSLTRIPLGITTYRDGWVIIQAAEIGQLPSDMDLYLIDKQTGITQDLKTNPSYRFYLQKGTYDQRFVLLFSISQTQLQPTGNEQLFVISKSGGKVLVEVNLGLDETGRLSMTNMVGQILMQVQVTGQQTVELPSNLSSGIYVVSLKAGLKIHSEKTILRKE